MVVVAFMVVGAEATVQIKDDIKVVGEKDKVLQSGFIEEDPLWPILSKKDMKFKSTCTANYSGYTADWLIKDKKLYLDNFYQGYTGLSREEIEANSRIKKLFPESQGPVLADWYTGKIHFGTGELKIRAISGHLLIFEKLHVYEIEKGLVKSHKVYDFPDNVDYLEKREREKGYKTDLKAYLKKTDKKTDKKKAK